jgi:hypothetical protein
VGQAYLSLFLIPAQKNLKKEKSEPRRMAGLRFPQNFSHRLKIRKWRRENVSLP